MTPARSTSMLLAMILGAAPVASRAAPPSDAVTTPVFKEGDSWVFDLKEEKPKIPFTERTNELSVERVGLRDIAFSVKTRGSSSGTTTRISPLDLSSVESIDGVETTTRKPFSFPLYPGKTWDLSYKQGPTKNNPTHISDQISIHYTVGQWETVQTPMGPIRALKIEGDGQWTAEIAPHQGIQTAVSATATGSVAVVQTDKTTSSRTTGRMDIAYWYAPSVKMQIKQHEEIYNASGVRTTNVESTMISYKLAP